MRVYLVPALFLVSTLVAGCGISSTPQNETAPAPETPQTPEELIAAWAALSDAKFEEMDFPMALAIVNTLAQTAPDRLGFLWDTLGNAQSKPNAKVLATICLTHFIKPEDTSRLVALAAPGQDRTTRGCALNMLMGIGSPEAVAAIRGALEDADSHVRAEAVISLLRLGDATALDKVEGIWNDPETSVAKRVEIILSIPDTAAAQFLPLLRDTAKRTDMDAQARKRAIAILAAFGAPEDIAVLESLANDTNPEIQAQAKAEVEAAKLRTDTPGFAPAGDLTPVSEPVPVPAPAV